MFTGLVETVGTVSAVRARGDGRELTIRGGTIIAKLRIGDSIAVDGCCQTVVRRGRGTFTVVAVQETLRKTTFGKYVSGTLVNLERPLRAGDRLGGHFVQGHVDCVTTVTRITGDDVARMYWFSIPPKRAHLLIPVGSIAVNGTSLTVARITRTAFAVAIIPHTWEQTTFRALAAGDAVNLEFDMLGKYVAQIVRGRRPSR